MFFRIKKTPLLCKGNNILDSAKIELRAGGAPKKVAGRETSGLAAIVQPRRGDSDFWARLQRANPIAIFNWVEP